MKFFLLLLLVLASPAVNAAPKSCDCKCVSKNEEGKLVTVEGSGKDRQAAGEKLKKNLGKQKCELTPTCSGKCSLDE